MDQNQTHSPEVPRSRTRLNSTIVATGAAVALTLAGLGISSAHTSSSTTTPDTKAPAASADTAKRGPGHRHHMGIRPSLAVAAEALGITKEALRTELRSGKSIAQVAKARNVDVKKVIDALVADVKARLAEKVEDGSLTQEQAERRSSGLEGRITAMVQVGRGPGGGPGNGHHAGAKIGLSAAAKAIGITEQELRTEMRSGRSIAQVAKARNVDVKKVIDTLVAEAKARLAEKVKAGTITQAQADEKAANLTERITAMVNHVGFGPRHGPGGHRGPGGSGGMRSDSGGAHSTATPVAHDA